MNHRILRTVCALLAASLLCACSQSRSGSGTASGRDTLRISVPQDAKTLDPILASNTIDGFVMRFMFEPLLSANPQGDPVPMLAAQVPSRENGGISADGLTITYRLRRNAKWTDGVPVTSRDVQFSWQAIMNPQNNAVSRNGYDDVTRIDTPNDYTVVVHLKKRFAPFVNTFFAESDQPYTVVPAHVLAKYPDINHVSFDSDPDVTDGPFRFQSWSHGDHIDLVANDGFFMGKPHLRRIVIHVVPDENTSVNLLRTHAIDYMFQASIATYPALHAAAGVHLVWVNMNGYEGIQFNMQRKPLDDPRVRLAIAYAIDKRRLVRDLTYGQEKLATEDLPDFMWAYNSALKPLAYDPSKARALLQGAGVKLPLDLVLVTDTANVTHKREAVQIQAMLHQVGIQVEVKTYPGDLLYAPAGAGGIVNGGSFDLVLWPWYAGIDPDNSSQFTCASIPPHGYNESRYCTPEMEALQSSALTHYDRATRTKAYHGIEALLARDHPLVAFWWQRQQEALSVDLHNFTPNPTEESWNAWEWSL
ncbi:MAG TPA: peptide ABC transporter substrate-binding protein [Candidatus Baltobacteraceae bacterium]|nr:peptide ABC transporter substrate-binding protein [Candidatus Baltobacteraceae bacterium]